MIARFETILADSERNITHVGSVDRESKPRGTSTLNVYGTLNVSGAASFATISGNVSTPAGKASTGFLQVFGKTSGGLKLTSADAAAFVATVSLAAQTVGATTLTIPNFAHVADTFVFTTLAQTLANKTFAAPVLGVATATSLNGLTITTGTGTLTVASGKTLTASNTLTFTGTDGGALAIGTGGTLGTAAYTAASTYATISGVETLTNKTLTAPILNGVTSGGDAGAGVVGEIITSVIASGSAVSLVSATAKTVTSISLTAGDWDVTGMVDFHPNSLTTGSYFQAGISATTNALGTQDQYTSAPMALAAGLGVDVGINCPVVRISVSAPTVIYLTCAAGFAVSTLAAYGTIRARRVR